MPLEPRDAVNFAVTRTPRHAMEEYGFAHSHDVSGSLTNTTHPLGSGVALNSNSPP